MTRHTRGVGFNPMRKRPATGLADYAMIAAALVIVAVLVAWGFFGGTI